MTRANVLAYTHYMKQYKPCMVFLLITSIFLASCSAGHVGSNEIAFIRNGHIWTVDPDGANAFQIVAQDAPVVGYSWSSNHQLLVFRTLDSQFAKTDAVQHLATNSVTGQMADAPATINTIGIDGGTPIPIMLSDASVQYSNPYWNPNGTRLIYRQESTKTPFVPGGALWWVSQNDQPEGIAVHHLPPSYSFPSISANNSMAIGNSQSGVFTSTLQGTNIHYLFTKSLPGHPLPATLERILWQPAHPHPLLLYATTLDTSHNTSSTKAAHTTVQLITLSQNGQSTILTTCACTQFAWSPDGSKVLYSTGETDTIFAIDTHATFDIPTEAGSVPYWSPNGAFLLLDGPHQLQLVTLSTRKYDILLTDKPLPVSQTPPSQDIGVNTLVQSVPNSLWSSDSLHFLFLTHGRLLWQGKRISSGLYTVTIDVHGQPQGQPIVVDSGNDTQPGWTFQNPDTSFLY